VSLLFSEGKGIKTLKSGVKVPTSVGTVVIYTKGNKRYIEAWELYNIDAVYDFQRCKRNPFFLFEKAGIEFKKGRGDFDFYSRDYE